MRFSLYDFSSLFAHNNQKSRWPMPTAFLLSALLILVAGCHGDERPRAQQLVLQGETMGTYYRVTVPHTVGEATPDQEELQQLVEMNLEKMNFLFSTYRRDSQITVFNALPAGECLQVDQDFVKLMAQARSVNERSNGRFNPAVAPLVRLWGFAEDRVVSPPSRQQVKEQLALIDFSRAYVQTDDQGERLCKRDPVELDFSALAKGYAVQQLANTLDELAVESYLVDIGGELFARGLNSRREHWSVAIEEPILSGGHAEPKHVAAVLTLSDQAIATSGNYRNYYEYQGVRYAHTIDPATGWPVAHGLLSVSVIHEDAALADAWATALMAAGLERAQQLVWENDLIALLIVDDAAVVPEKGKYHRKGLETKGRGDYTLWYTQSFSGQIFQDPDE